MSPSSSSRARRPSGSASAPASGCVDTALSDCVVTVPLLTLALPLGPLALRGTGGLVTLRLGPAGRGDRDRGVVLRRGLVLDRSRLALLGRLRRLALQVLLVRHRARGRAVAQHVELLAHGPEVGGEQVDQ